MQYAKFRIHSPGDIVPFFPVNYGAEHESTLWLKYSVEAHNKKGLREPAGGGGGGRGPRAGHQSLSSVIPAGLTYSHCLQHDSVML